MPFATGSSARRSTLSILGFRLDRFQFLQACNKKPYQFLAIGIDGLVSVIVGNKIDIAKKFKPVERFARLLERNRPLGNEVSFDCAYFASARFAPIEVPQRRICLDIVASRLPRSYLCSFTTRMAKALALVKISEPDMSAFLSHLCIYRPPFFRCLSRIL